MTLKQYITGPLWGESTCHWWIPFTKGQVMLSFEVYFCCELEQAVQQTVNLPVILNDIILKWHHPKE